MAVIHRDKLHISWKTHEQFSWVDDIAAHPAHHRFNGIKFGQIPRGSRIDVVIMETAPPSNYRLKYRDFFSCRYFRRTTNRHRFQTNSNTTSYHRICFGLNRARYTLTCLFRLAFVCIGLGRSQSGAMLYAAAVLPTIPPTRTPLPSPSYDFVVSPPSPQHASPRQHAISYIHSYLVDSTMHRDGSSFEPSRVEVGSFFLLRQRNFVPLC